MRPRVLAAALVAITLLPLSAAAQGQAQRTQAGPGYDDLLREYRSGDSAAAVRALIGWPAARVRALLNQASLPDTLSPASTGAAALVVMLHTEAVLGGATADAHLAVIRRALGPLYDRPDARSFIASWRIVMASYLLSAGRSQDATILVGGAQTDGEMLLLLGSISEAAARERRPSASTALTATVGSTRKDAWVQLAEAEQDYRRALERDPSLEEARVRLGRVLALEGKNELAIETLTEAKRRVGGEGFLAYLAALFLGAVNEQLGLVGAAADCYGAAIKVYPEAQTAYIALGHLLESSGRTDAAWATVGQMFGASGNPVRDPWWVYSHAQFWEINERVEKLRSFARR